MMSQTLTHVLNPRCSYLSSSKDFGLYLAARWKADCGTLPCSLPQKPCHDYLSRLRPRSLYNLYDIDVLTIFLTGDVIIRSANRHPITGVAIFKLLIGTIAVPMPVTKLWPVALRLYRYISCKSQ